MNIRLLRADEIECRVGTFKDGKGLSLLLYKDARVDMNILDETFGRDNWQRHHEVINNNLFCNVGVRFERENGLSDWVWKQDVGTESNAEKEKGQASDAFKRACFNWGIGRELYTAPFIWIAETNKYTKFKVKEISYNDNREIIGLVIVDDKGRERFNYTGKGKTQPVQAPRQTRTKEQPKQQTSKQESSYQCSDCSESITQAVNEYSTKNMGKPLCFNCQKNYRK